LDERKMKQEIINRFEVLNTRELLLGLESLS